jgi:hypothetical protein
MSLTSYRAAPPRDKAVTRATFRAGWYVTIETAVVKADQQETVIVVGQSC